MKFNKETIRDPEVVNIEGATMLLPEGWKREGGFVWMTELKTQGNLLMLVSDPNTGASLQTLLSQHFVWSSQSSMQLGSSWFGSVMLPQPREPAECVHVAFIAPGVLQHLRGARLMRVDDLQGYGAELSRSIPHMTVQANRLRYAFDWGGRGWEEDVYLTAVFYPPEGWLSMWWCTAWSLRAPVGQLDRAAPLLAAIMLSVRYTYDWLAMLDYAQIEFSMNIRRQQTSPNRDRRGIIWSQTETPGSMWIERQDEIRRRHRSTWEGRQPALERERIALSQIIGGIETYINPFDSSRLQLPSGYSACWVSKEGQVNTSNDAAFDPGAGSTAEWREMSRYMPQPQGGWQY